MKPLKPPPEVCSEIVRQFLSGQSINHIVFLHGYRWRIDYVTEAVRAELKRLRQEVSSPHRAKVPEGEK